MVCKPPVCCPDSEKQPQSEWWGGAQGTLETCPGCCLGSRGGGLWIRKHRFPKPKLSSGQRRVCVSSFPVLCTLGAQTHTPHQSWEHPQCPQGMPLLSSLSCHSLNRQLLPSPRALRGAISAALLHGPWGLAWGKCQSAFSLKALG